MSEELTGDKILVITFFVIGFIAGKVFKYGIANVDGFLIDRWGYIIKPAWLILVFAFACFFFALVKLDKEHLDYFSIPLAAFLCTCISLLDYHGGLISSGNSAARKVGLFTLAFLFIAVVILVIYSQ